LKMAKANRVVFSLTGKRRHVSIPKFYGVLVDLLCRPLKNRQKNRVDPVSLHQNVNRVDPVVSRQDANRGVDPDLT
jgi:hypothetical protein